MNLPSTFLLICLDPEADPGFLETGFICLKVCVCGGGGGGGFAMLILSHFS